MKRSRSGYNMGAKRRRTRLAPRRRRNRSRFYRNRGGKAAYTKILRQPVPDRIFSRFTYCDNYTISLQNPGGAGMQSQSWWTSMYDPDYTGLGHQPLWYDQVAPMWSKYRVYGIKYVLEAMNTNTNQLATMVVQHSSDIAELPGTGNAFSTLRERNNSRTYTLTSSQGRPIKVKGYMSTYRPFGMTKTDFIGDEDFEAAIANTPAKTAYLHTYFVTFNSTAIINLQVRLVYYVELFQRKNVSGS